MTVSTTAQQIAAFNARLCRALDAGDVEAVLDCYTEDGVLLAPGTDIVSGREALREWWSAFFAGGFSGAEMTSERIVEDRADLVVEIGRYRMTLNVGGEEVVDHGKYAVTYRRGADGRLRYAVDALNSSGG
jgi:uncharacterized protein (TIGR02246 family)